MRMKPPLYAEDGSDCSDQIITALNDDLAAASAGATAYDGGLMYYNIPIEHLNNAGVAENETIPEAKYGVVRNHHYVVTIDKLEKIGKGIFVGNEKNRSWLSGRRHVLRWRENQHPLVEDCQPKRRTLNHCMNNHSMRTKPLMEWPLKNASAPAQREDGIGKGAFANFL